MVMNLNRAPFILGLVFFLLQSCSTNSEDVDQLVTMSTRLGDIKFILFEDTPMHKASFLELAGAGAYDSTTFHQVIKDFILQAGNFADKPEFEKESRRLIPAEIISNHLNKRGMIGAARQGVNVNPERKSTTQFYIVQGKKLSRKELTTEIGHLNGALSRFLYDGKHQDLIDEFKQLQDSGKDDELQERVLELREEIEAVLNLNFENTDISQAQVEAYTTVGGAPHLDGNYTVFGQVVEGMEVVDLIAALDVDEADIPLEPVYIQLKIEDIAKDSLTAWYGITYAKNKIDEHQK